MKLLIDNGHAYIREIADRVINRLQAVGIDSIRIVFE